MGVKGRRGNEKKVGEAKDVIRERRKRGSERERD